MSVLMLNMLASTWAITVQTEVPGAVPKVFADDAGVSVETVEEAQVFPAAVAICRSHLWNEGEDQNSSKK